MKITPVIPTDIISVIPAPPLSFRTCFGIYSLFLQKLLSIIRRILHSDNKYGTTMLPTTKTFKARQFIYQEGESANEMYIIISGKVKIAKNIGKNPVVIATLEKGGFFGEVALFREKQHSATAIAETDLELAVIKKESFYQQFEQLPSWCLTIVQSMANRLHNALEQLSSITVKPPPPEEPGQAAPEAQKDESKESQPDKEEKQDNS